MLKLNLKKKYNKTKKKIMLLPVNIYCESALNAASQTHRFASCWSTCTSEKSVVFQTRAVWSADVVTKSLDKIHDFI